MRRRPGCWASARRPPASASSGPWNGSRTSSRCCPASARTRTSEETSTTAVARSWNRGPAGGLSMPASSSERDPVEQLADEFLERFRRGERPALTEYTQRYPQWAERIRKVFPALVLLEGIRPDTGEATGAD